MLQQTLPFRSRRKRHRLRCWMDDPSRKLGADLGQFEKAQQSSVFPILSRRAPKRRLGQWWRHRPERLLSQEEDSKALPKGSNPLQVSHRISFCLANLQPTLTDYWRILTICFT